MDRVAFVSPRYPPFLGGVETHVSELASRAKKRYHQVSVITTDPVGYLPPIQDEKDGMRIFRVRSFAPRENYHFPLIPSFLKRLRECHPEILHLHSLHDVPGPLAGFLERKGSLILTPHFHGAVYSMLGRVFFRAYSAALQGLIQRVARVICVSRYEARLMVAAFPGSLNKVRVIPNGVDMKLLSEYSWREPEEPRIIYVGRLERYKNVDKIIRAFAELRKSNETLRLAIVGRGPLKAELVRLADGLRLGEELEWYEGIPRSKLYELYSSSTMLVLPSELEAYGIVAAEAIALRVPTLVANSSGLTEFVEAGLAVSVEPPVDEGKLASKILQVLENPRQFSFGGRSELIQSWDEVAETTFELYESQSAA